MGNAPLCTDCQLSVGWQSVQTFSDQEPSQMSSQRSRVIQLYKNLLYLGREYPQGYDYFRGKCHAAFMRNKGLEGPQVEEWLAKGDYIIKELEALYMLKKYRTLKRRYYKEEEGY